MGNDVIEDDSHKAKATWRKLTLNNVPDVCRIAAQVHVGLPERDQVFAERVKLFPEGCLGLVSSDDSNELLGYAISHPIRRRQPPDLDSLLGEIAPDADQYYIHDLAILPAVRGGGFSQAAVKELLTVAERFPTICLISVYGTTSFWSRFGFTSVASCSALEKKLLEYGDDATFLERANDGYHDPPKLV